MVTASHNPPADNGYKVYDGTGRQIVAPTDAHIAGVLEGIDRVAEVPRANPEDPDIVHLDDTLVAAYVDGASAVGLVPDARDVRAVYTAMHGVGATTFHRVMAAAGFARPADVTEQVDPDPDFPTVSFPNPEEPGALDLGLALAAASGAQVLIANDPDADRLGVAVPDPARGTSDTVEGWRALRGDEIGVILADHLLRHGGVAPADDVFATTIVSSTLLGRMALAASVGFRETLTGFKWISRAAGEGQVLRFGYEEALGFAVAPSFVSDKDGITAAVVFAEAVAVQARAGRTVLDVLDDLARTHGVHRTGQWSVRVAGADPMVTLTAAMTAMRSAPPADLAGRAVTSLVDLIDGDPAAGLAPSDVLILHLDGARIVVRPSGTEPKLKCYLEVIEPVTNDDLAAAGADADRTLAALTEAIAHATGLA
jgi:phosphomannomutase